MVKKVVVMLGMVGLLWGVSSVQATFTDDFGSDLSKWDVNDSDPYVTIQLDGNGHLVENVANEPANEYHSGSVVGKIATSVGANSIITMEIAFYLPSGNSASNHYATWRLTPNADGGAENSIEYCTFMGDSGSDGYRWHWFRIWDADGTVHEYPLGKDVPYNQGWQIFDETWYKVTLTIDQANDQASISIYDLDNSSPVGTKTEDYSSGFKEKDNYYPAIVITVKNATSSTGTTHLTDYCNVVPEPATITLLGLGMVGLIRRKR